MQSNGQLTLFSPSASSILPFVSSSHETEEQTRKRQAKADGSAIALREDSISLVGKVFVNNVDLEETLNNTVTTASATQMETTNTIITSDSINIKFEHIYSQMPSLTLTNAKKEPLNYTYTFITNSNQKYTGANVYFTNTPEQQENNIIVVGSP